MGISEDPRREGLSEQACPRDPTRLPPLHARRSSCVFGIPGQLERGPQGRCGRGEPRAPGSRNPHPRRGEPAERDVSGQQPPRRSGARVSSSTRSGSRDPRRGSGRRGMPVGPETWAVWEAKYFPRTAPYLLPASLSFCPSVPCSCSPLPPLKPTARQPEAPSFLLSRPRSCCRDGAPLGCTRHRPSSRPRRPPGPPTPAFPPLLTPALRCSSARPASLPLFSAPLFSSALSSSPGFPLLLLPLPLPCPLSIFQRPSPARSQPIGSCQGPSGASRLQAVGPPGGGGEGPGGPRAPRCWAPRAVETPPSLPSEPLVGGVMEDQEGGPPTSCCSLRCESPHTTPLTP